MSEREPFHHEQNRAETNISRPYGIEGTLRPEAIDVWHATRERVRTGILRADRIAVVRDDKTVGDAVIATFCAEGLEDILASTREQPVPVDLYVAKQFAGLYKGFEQQYEQARVIGVEPGFGVYKAREALLHSWHARYTFLLDLTNPGQPLKLFHRQEPKTASPPMMRPYTRTEGSVFPRSRELLTYTGDLFKHAAYTYAWDEFGTERFTQFMLDTTGMPEGSVRDKLQPKIYLPNNHRQLAEHVASTTRLPLEQPQIPIVATASEPGKRYDLWPEVVMHLSQALPDTHFVFITGNSHKEFMRQQYSKIMGDSALRDKVHFAQGSLLELASYYKDANISRAASNDTGVGPHLMCAVEGGFPVSVVYGPFQRYDPEHWTWSELQVPISLGYKLSSFVENQTELHRTEGDKPINQHDPASVAYDILVSSSRKNT